MVVVTIKGVSYYMNERNKDKWDKIKDGGLNKLDEDRVYVVDGKERSGKSVFTLQQAAYIDPSIVDNLNRICFSPDEFLSAIRNTDSDSKHTKVIIFDEAFSGLSSRSALSKVNKKIVQALMEMGQKNLVVFIVLPTFYLLDLYVAVLRSNALFHIDKQKNSRNRSFRIFNYSKKARLYNTGIKKGWGYPVYTKLRDRFFEKYPGGDAFEKAYRKKKLDSIRRIGEDKPVEDKFLLNYHKLVYIIYTEINKISKISQKGLSDLLKNYEMSLSQQMISEILRKYLEKPEEITNTSDQYI